MVAVLPFRRPGYAGGEQEGCCAMATVTRADLSEVVCREIGLSRRETADFVESVLELISDRLAAGEMVNISGFGSFTLRDKEERLGRNPRTGEPAPISARRVVIFRPSARLKGRIDKGMACADALGPAGWVS